MDPVEASLLDVHCALRAEQATRGNPFAVKDDREGDPTDIANRIEPSAARPATIVVGLQACGFYLLINNPPVMILDNIADWVEWSNNVMATLVCSPACPGPSRVLTLIL